MAQVFDAPDKYLRFHDKKKIEEAVNDETISKRPGQPDFVSLYRALARQLEGDPTKHLQVRRNVLDTFFRMTMDPEHPSLKEASHYDDDSPIPFLSALTWPDACSSEESLKTLLWFIADILGAKICVWKASKSKKPGDFDYHQAYGKQKFPIAHLLRDELDKGRYQYHSLVEDDSGRALIEKMREERAKGTLPIYEARWRFAKDQVLDLEKPNYRRPEVFFSRTHHDRQKLPNMSGEMRALCVFNVSIDKATQIEPAIQLLQSILEIAPAQEIPHRTADGTVRRLRRYCTVDCEFAYVQTFKRAKDELEKLQSNSTNKLCSVLTVAVDRHVVFTFFLKEIVTTKPDRKTVAQITKLYRNVLLNPEYLKIWFNNANDFSALFNLLSYMYQKTPLRERILYTFQDSANWKMYEDPKNNPRFKPMFALGDRKWKWTDKAFKSELPHDLEIPLERDDIECPMHLPNDPKVDFGIPVCQCSKGNIEIMALLDSVTREFGMPRAPGFESYLEKRDPKYRPAFDVQRRKWWLGREAVNYQVLLKMMLNDHPLFPLFEYFKNGFTQWTARTNLPKKMFYEGMKGAEMIKDPDLTLLGYLAGDVVPLALMVRMFTTLDHREVFVSRLYNIHRASDFEANPMLIEDPLISQASDTAHTLDVPLINDFPKMWKRAAVGDIVIGRLWGKGKGTTKTPLRIFRFEQDRDALGLSYTEHEDQVEILLSAVKDNILTPKWRNTPSLDRFATIIIRRTQIETFDPTLYNLPDVMTFETDHDPIYRLLFKPAVPSGYPHERNLRETIRIRGHGSSHGGIHSEQDTATIKASAPDPKTTCVLSAFKNRDALLGAMQGQDEREPMIDVQTAYRLNLIVIGRKPPSSVPVTIDVEKPFIVKDFIFDPERIRYQANVERVARAMEETKQREARKEAGKIGRDKYKRGVVPGGRKPAKRGADALEEIRDQLEIPRRLWQVKRIKV